MRRPRHLSGCDGPIVESNSGQFFLWIGTSCLMSYTILRVGHEYLVYIVGSLPMSKGSNAKKREHTTSMTIDTIIELFILQ
jgi:hypothetical protein